MLDIQSLNVAKILNDTLSIHSLVNGIMTCWSFWTFTQRCHSKEKLWHTPVNTELNCSLKLFLVTGNMANTTSEGRSHSEIFCRFALKQTFVVFMTVQNSNICSKSSNPNIVMCFSHHSLPHSTLFWGWPSTFEQLG